MVRSLYCSSPELEHELKIEAEGWHMAKDLSEWGQYFCTHGKAPHRFAERNSEAR
jgi:hypothetical protein